MSRIRNDPQRTLTRHVYFGLEMIQEYVCGDGGEGASGVAACSVAMPLVREYYWDDPERYPEAVAMIRHRVKGR